MIWSGIALVLLVLARLFGLGTIGVAEERMQNVAKT